MIENQTLDIDSSLLDARIVFIMQEIDDTVAKDVIGKLLVLNAVSYDTIEIYINSPGGNVDAGLAIYDVIKTLKANVRTVCVGNCSSMAAVLLAAGDERYAFKNATIMIHQISGGVHGKKDEIECYSNSMETTNRKISKILAKVSKKPLKTILKDTKLDKYMSAQEALDYGLIDHVIKSIKK